MRGSPRGATGNSDVDGTGPVVRLAAVRVQGFRGIADIELELDPVTTVIGEHEATKAAFVEILALCLGPGQTDRPRFSPSDFAEPAQGGPRRILATFQFSEAAVGAWREREPALAAVSIPGRDRRLTLSVEVRADHAPRARIIEALIRIPGAAAHVSSTLTTSAWRRLRTLSPVLVLGAARDGAAASAQQPEAGRSPAHAEIARLYRRLRDSSGRLTAQEIESARDALRDDMRLRASDALMLQDERALVDVVDWQRPGKQDVTDDAVQDVLMRLMRAGLVIEAQRSGRIHREAHPIVVVDSPDARLHPILVARVWRFLHSVASQVVVTTNSAEIVAASPLRSLRRLTRGDRRVHVTRVHPTRFSIDDLRRVVYHVRLKRGASLMARTWFLLEGETELWVLSEFAAMLGYSFAAEGVACIEFAQCGLSPLLRLADQLGIGWHVLADGDAAGVAYATQARSHLAGRRASSHVTMLADRDIEHVLWRSGYSDVFRRAAGASQLPGATPRAVIGRAVARVSKPLLAIRIIEEAVRPGSPGVPHLLAEAIRAAVALARRRAGSG